MRLLKFLAFLAITILGIAFTALNPDPVDLHYYYGVERLPLSLALILALILGALLGALAGLGGMLRLKRENADLRRKVRLAGEELSNLRSIPIKDQ